VDWKSNQGTLTKEVLERKYSASFEECEKKNKTNILKGGIKMEKILFAIVLVFVLYDLLSLVKILVKIKKAGRTNCSFKMSLSKIVFGAARYVRCRLHC